MKKKETVKKAGAGKKAAAQNERWVLKLYVAGPTPKAAVALENLKKICAEYLMHRYTIQVIDLLKNPSLARGDQIIAVPTLVRHLPPPIKKIIGDLSNRERVIVGLNIVPAGGPAAAQSGR